jgi:anti-sigma B factor antagonist
MYGFASNARRDSRAVPHTYRIETYTTAPGDYVVALEGELDLAARPELDRELERLENRNPRRVVADLTAATFVDAATLGLLSGAQERLSAVRAELRVVCNDRHTLNVIRLTGLDRALEIFETIAQAVGTRAYPANVVVLRRAGHG